MPVQLIDPVEYPGWDALLERSGDHSFFHTSSWARVLRESYRYRPLYFAFLENDRLACLMPFMDVRSPLTGRRGVSLPFTDQCEPFCPRGALFAEAVQSVIDHGRGARWRYIEWRGSGRFADDVPVFESYWTHDLDLGRGESGLYARLKDSNRRNIARALQEGVAVDIGRSPAALKAFHRLNGLTRQRHGLPPQPFRFFQNVDKHILAKNSGVVASASVSGRVIAASIFFHFGSEAIYKYGASDGAHHHLRPNNLVMWEAIKWYQRQGLKSLNLGRTAPGDEGLLQYKRTWGAEEKPVRYYRYEPGKASYLSRHRAGTRVYQRVFRRTPVLVLRVIGRLLYRHSA